jgi:hypothetical protein
MFLCISLEKVKIETKQIEPFGIFLCNFITIMKIIFVTSRRGNYEKKRIFPFIGGINIILH